MQLISPTLRLALSTGFLRGRNRGRNSLPRVSQWPIAQVVPNGILFVFVDTFPRLGICNTRVHASHIYIYRYRQVFWKNDRPAERNRDGRCSRGPTKGCMIDRAMACQIMQFYFIWFREGNCYFGGSAAPNGRRSDVLAWLFLPLCRLPPPLTPLLISLPLSLSLSFRLAIYINSSLDYCSEGGKERIDHVRKKVENRRLAALSPSKTARNDKSRVFLPPRSGNAPNHPYDWFRSPDLPRFALILRNVFCEIRDDCQVMARYV